MNSENKILAMKEKVAKKEMTEHEMHERWDWPSIETIAPLKRIVQETGAIIVLSSTWRHTSRWEPLKQLFVDNGLLITDRTCHGVYLSDVESFGFDINNCYSVYSTEEGRMDAPYTTDRGAEIAKWLSEHPDVESFVIIDDDWPDIIPYYPDNYVQTYFYGDWGLTEEKATEAIKILGGKKA